MEAEESWDFESCVPVHSSMCIRSVLPPACPPAAVPLVLRLLRQVWAPLPWLYLAGLTNLELLLRAVVLGLQASARLLVRLYTVYACPCPGSPGLTVLGWRPSPSHTPHCLH